MHPTLSNARQFFLTRVEGWRHTCSTCALKLEFTGTCKSSLIKNHSSQGLVQKGYILIIIIIIMMVYLYMKRLYIAVLSATTMNEVYLL